LGGSEDTALPLPFFPPALAVLYDLSGAGDAVFG
jgi:hypothetical protein